MLSNANIWMYLCKRGLSFNLNCGKIFTEEVKMTKTYDVRIEKMIPLIAPNTLRDEIPISDRARNTVVAGRQRIENILSKNDKRMLVIAGPCSVHDEKAALEYAEKLIDLSKKVEKTMLVVMRVYFEKPRTTIGWKGLINDPFLDGTHDITEGLRRARSLLHRICEMGLPTATELLDPITPQYIAGLVCWTAVGARTTESQTHREMASGLSMPVGFKNSTDGTLTAAINALQAAKAPQSFLGIDGDGYSSIVKARGNPWGHIVLRGGERPNYDPVSINNARIELAKKGLTDAIMVDCSHDNCGKKFQGQGFVWKSAIDQRLEGNDAIIGLMLESNLREGNQKCNGDLSSLEYGVSITDECISWETTEDLLMLGNKKLS
jgi:3-deoxy-7-phosphoheptulonate synthase